MKRYRRFDQWRDRGRARRLHTLARFCRHIAGNADRIADALEWEKL